MPQEEDSLRDVGRRGLRHLFPSLDEEGRALWEARMSWSILAKGDVLFREGDPSVDAMRRLLPPGSAIVAVDVTDTSVDETSYDFPPTLGFVNSLLMFFRLKGRRYRFPNFRDTLLKALMVGAFERIEKNRVEADFLIRPDLGSIGMTDFRAGLPLIETGYRETHRLLEALPDTDRSRIFREDPFEQQQAAERATGIAI